MQNGLIFNHRWVHFDCKCFNNRYIDVRSLKVKRDLLNYFII